MKGIVYEKRVSAFTSSFKSSAAAAAAAAATAVVATAVAATAVAASTVAVAAATAAKIGDKKQKVEERKGQDDLIRI